MEAELDRLDHVAVVVPDIAAAVDWYTSHMKCEVKYQDATWAMLKFANTGIALVMPGQHPGHLGFVSNEAEKHGELKTHRDGTRSCYIHDPAGNAVEILAADSMPPA
jgi:catechol 2,3-dioxygenase-like lactoylglutathione lyase family enzyme